MNKIFKFYIFATNYLNRLEHLALLFVRLILSYGFYEPALMKVKSTSTIAVWFAQMNIPFPLFFAFTVGVIEFLGFICLSLGLATRLFAIALIFVMLFAIKFLHWQNGFRAYYNGFEIHLYYIVMLFVLLCKGAGNWSIDNLLQKKIRQ